MVIEQPKLRSKPFCDSRNHRKRLQWVAGHLTLLYWYPPMDEQYKAWSLILLPHSLTLYCFYIVKHIISISTSSTCSTSLGKNLMTPPRCRTKSIESFVWLFLFVLWIVQSPKELDSADHRRNRAIICSPDIAVTPVMESKDVKPILDMGFASDISWRIIYHSPHPISFWAVSRLLLVLPPPLLSLHLLSTPHPDCHGKSPPYFKCSLPAGIPFPLQQLLPEPSPFHRPGFLDNHWEKILSLQVLPDVYLHDSESVDW